MKSDHSRTLSIVRELAQGKELEIPDMGTIKMGEDMSIGYIITTEDGEEGIMPLATLDLRQLNQLLTKHNIGTAAHK